jgi:hypothetical protein
MFPKPSGVSSGSMWTENKQCSSCILQTKCVRLTNYYNSVIIIILNLQVEGKYEITGTSFTSILKFQTPYEKLAKGEAEVHVSFNHPNSYEFKAVAKTDNVIFDVDVALSLEAVDNKFLRFGAVVPALGINEDDLKIAFGYRVVSASDFELVAEASIAGTPRKAVLKYKYEPKPLLHIFCH